MRSRTQTAPIALSGFLCIAVILLGLRRIWLLSGVVFGLVGATIAVYLVWLVAESKWVSLREISLPEAPGDKGSCEAYAVAQGCTVLVALIVPSPPTAISVRLFGLILMLAGIGVRLSAISTLGELYSRRVRLVASHRVVTSGPYRLVRHPAYLGTLLGHLGFVTVLGSWIGAVVWAAFFVPMVVRRVVLEERLLFGLEGYAQYARRQKRLLPWVW